MERFQNHIALSGKNAGCIGKFLGRVLLVVFLVDDAKNKWDAESETQYRALMKKICLRLMKESGLPRSRLSITFGRRRASVPYEVTRANDQKMIRDVLRTCYCDDPESFRKEYSREMDRDEVCVSFVLNRPFTSYAQQMLSLDGILPAPNGIGNEMSVVSFRKQDLAHSEHSMVHELMHQFGAIDLYSNPVAAKAAAKYLPESIMNDGEKIDALTRFVIGWEDTLTPEAIAFLQATASLTLKDIQKPK